MKNVVQTNGVSKTASDVYDDLVKECMFIKAAADMFFTLGNEAGLDGLPKETTSVMTSRVMDTADRVETLLGEYNRLLRAEYEQSKPAATSG